MAESSRISFRLLSHSTPNADKTENTAAVDDEKVTLTLRYRRPKLVGKGKEDVVEDKEILYSDIKKALIVIKF
jgi:ribosome maturation factor RimP